MFCEEQRPLKRPKLGVPDVYPQENRQKEDELNDEHVRKGFLNRPHISSEYGSALNEIDLHSRNHAKEVTTRLRHIVDLKKRAGWVQDGQKKKPALAKEMFFPISNPKKHELLPAWFHDLAGNKSIKQLLRISIPLLTKKEDMFDLLCKHNIPMSRAAWFIKITVAHNLLLNEVRMRRKQVSDPGQEWTNALTSYLRENAVRLFHVPPQDRDKSEAPGEGDSTSYQAKWKYGVRLANWMYGQGLLDRHEFLKWLMDFMDMTCIRQHHPNEEPLCCLLPIVVHYLQDITKCISLSRQLIRICVKKFTQIYNMGEKHSLNLRRCWEVNKEAVMKIFETVDGQSTGSGGVSGSAGEDLEVTNSPLFTTPVKTPKSHRSAHASTPTKSLSSKSSDSMDTMPPPTIPSLLGKTPGDSEQGVSKETLSSGSVARRRSTAGDQEDFKPTASTDTAADKEDKSDVVAITQEPDLTNFSWCTCHKDIINTLSHIIQMIAIHCTSALVALPSKAALPPASLQGKTGAKIFRPLEVLPIPLHQLPCPPKASKAEKDKVKSLLMTIEDEVMFRSKCVENGWSASDQQSPTEGSNVKRILSVLECLDEQHFMKSGAHNTVASILRSLKPLMANPQTQVKDNHFVMLLCQWAISPHRDGQHRPLVSAMLIKHRHDELVKKFHGSTGSKVADHGANPMDFMSLSYDGVGEEGTSKKTSFYPFQDVLFKFLDIHAPPWRGSHRHATGENPFFLLMILFGELIQMGVFSYSVYLSSLIARGDLVSPIIPRLMLGDDTIEEDQIEATNQEMSLMISIPYMKMGKPSDLSSGSGLDKSSKENKKMDTSPETTSFVIATGTARVSSETHSHGEMATPEQMHLRQNQLEQLLNSQSHDPGPFSPFDSPTLGNSPPHDQSSFGSLSTPHFPDIGGGHVDKSFIKVTGPPTARKKNTHHAIFASYMPFGSQIVSRSVGNERLTILCGVGKGKAQVRQAQNKLEHDFLELYYSLRSMHALVRIQWFKQSMWEHYTKLPLFYKSAITHRVSEILREPLPVQYPTVAQLCVVAEMMEESGNFRGLIDLLVDLVAAGRKSDVTSSRSGSATNKGDDFLDPAHKPLPHPLCFLVTSILHRHLATLFLSEDSTCVVFESLCLILRSVPLTSFTLSQKSVFIFLHKVYHSSQYVHATYDQSLSDGALARIKDRQRLQTSIKPVATAKINWIQTTLVNQLTKPLSCNVVELSDTLKISPEANSFTFVCEALHIACSEFPFLEICNLAQLVAEVSCLCPFVPPEILGALTALSLPFEPHLGFTQLALIRNAHTCNQFKNLVIFTILLIAHGTIPLTDIITCILRPLIRTYLSQSSAMPSATYQVPKTLVNLLLMLILMLLVDPEYIPEELSCTVMINTINSNFPLYVVQQMKTKRRELGLPILIGLLKDLLKIAQPTLSKDMTVGSGRTGMQIHVQAASSSSSDVRQALEALARQPWLGEMCHREQGKLLDKDKFFGEASLTPLQTRYLLMLLCPIEVQTSKTLSSLEQADLVKDCQAGINYILKNLDQWTLRSSLIHISALIMQTPQMNRLSLIDSLASSVIQVFEDSCSEEWVGQPIEMTLGLDQGDGAYSPPIWLVTPLVSKLSVHVLGRVLKNAGTVLGRGQWWSLEKNLEKKRTTRQTSTSQGKYGLQWQQPFLELVLACMKPQRVVHEELLSPLQKQLQNFLTAFEKEGLPGDEMAKSTLKAALKLRLSLIGSMLLSLRDSEAFCTDWVILLLQLLISGAVDRQPEDNELFTCTLDMVSTLLSWLPSDFLIVPPATGDENKKAIPALIRKIKSDSFISKSTCLNEIRQLFPLSQSTVEVTAVKPPAWTQNSLPEKIRGLRVQDTKEISPWDMIEGIRNYGPLSLMWFGAIKVDRKPPKYEEQWQLTQVHTHNTSRVDHRFVRFADPDELEAANAPPAKTSQKQGESSQSDQTPTEGVPMQPPATLEGNIQQPVPPSAASYPPQTHPQPIQPRPTSTQPTYPPVRGPYPQSVEQSAIPGRMTMPPQGAVMPPRRPMNYHQPVMMAGHQRMQEMPRPVQPRYSHPSYSSMPANQMSDYELQIQRRHQLQQQQHHQQQQQQYMIQRMEMNRMRSHPQFRVPAPPNNPNNMMGAYHQRVQGGARMQMTQNPQTVPMHQAHLQPGMPRQVRPSMTGHPGMTQHPAPSYTRTGPYPNAPQYGQGGYYQ